MHLLFHLILKVFRGTWKDTFRPFKAEVIITTTERNPQGERVPLIGVLMYDVRRKITVSQVELRYRNGYYERGTDRYPQEYPIELIRSRTGEIAHFGSINYTPGERAEIVAAIAMGRTRKTITIRSRFPVS